MTALVLPGFSEDPGVGLVAAADVLVVIAFAVLGVSSIALAVIDIAVRRLPDPIVIPTFLVVVVLLALAAVLAGASERILRALLGAVVLLVVYLAIRLASRGAIGFGDVKLAAILGLATAWVGWDAFVVGALSAFLLGGAYAILLLALRRARRRTEVPFGPWMLAGGWLGIAFGPSIWTGYAAAVGIAPTL